MTIRKDKHSLLLAAAWMASLSSKKGQETEDGSQKKPILLTSVFGLPASVFFIEYNTMLAGIPKFIFIKTDTH